MGRGRRGRRGRRGGRRGFWTRPRAAGESMEEVIYMRTDRRPSWNFCTFPIDLVVVLRLFSPHDKFNERSPVTGEHRSTHGTDCPVSGSAMLGISTQRNQFCRFIWFRETRGSEYSVHCLFVYHASRATDVDNMLTMLTFFPEYRGKQGW